MRAPKRPGGLSDEVSLARWLDDRIFHTHHIWHNETFVDSAMSTAGSKESMTF
jgi:hypothetical protein